MPTTRPPSHEPLPPVGRLEDFLDAPSVEVDPATGQELELATPQGVVPADSTALAALHRDSEWADVFDGDLAPSVRRIPYLKINRNLDGGFTDPDSGEVSRDLDFIWLAKGRSRAWFREAFGVGDGAPACRSADGTKADDGSPDMQNGGDCLTCPLNQFDEDKRGTITNLKGAVVPAPRCRESVEAMVFLPDPMGGIGQLARMRWNGIAAQPATRYWDSFFVKVPVVPPIGFVSHVELVAMATSFGEKLAPRFERVTAISRADAAPLIAERDSRLDDWRADTAADLAEGVGQDDDARGGAAGAGSGEEPF